MSDRLASDIAMDIAKRLTALRLSKAWTRQTLAEKTGVNVHTLKRFERTGQISFERLIAICQTLDVSHELERLFKPRHRVCVDDWQINDQTVLRKRGRRRTARLTS